MAIERIARAVSNWVSIPNPSQDLLAASQRNVEAPVGSDLVAPQLAPIDFPHLRLTAEQQKALQEQQALLYEDVEELVEIATAKKHPIPPEKIIEKIQELFTQYLNEDPRVTYLVNNALRLEKVRILKSKHQRIESKRAEITSQLNALNTVSFKINERGKGIMLGEGLKELAPKMANTQAQTDLKTELRKLDFEYQMTQGELNTAEFDAKDNISRMHRVTNNDSDKPVIDALLDPERDRLAFETTVDLVMKITEYKNKYLHILSTANLNEEDVKKKIATQIQSALHFHNRAAQTPTNAVA